MRLDPAHRESRPVIYVDGDPLRPAAPVVGESLDGPRRAMVEVAVEPRSDARAHLTISLDFEGHGIGRLPVPTGPVGRCRAISPP